MGPALAKTFFGNYHHPALGLVGLVVSVEQYHDYQSCFSTCYVFNCTAAKVLHSLTLSVHWQGVWVAACIYNLKGVVTPTMYQ